jgi:pimeloyl-ACP methyl ester carboxylesterase
MINVTRLVLSLFIVNALSGGTVRGADPKSAQDVAGDWQGALKVGAIELRLVIHLTRQPDGSLRGTLDSVDQGAKGIPISSATFKDETLCLDLKGIGASYEGKRVADRSAVEGKWRQSGQSFPLTFRPGTVEAKRPQLPKKPYPYREEEVTYENKPAGVKIAGTLTIPRGEGPFPAVLLITGSGPQDRDESLMGHKPFLVLADYLTRRGIAVLRVDDRGVGGSTGKTMESTSADFAGDALAGVDFLKGRKEINPKQIGLVGHSEGGMVAPMAAARSKDVAFLVLLAGTGLPGEEIMYLQGQLILKAAGAPAEELPKQRKLQERLFAIVKAEKEPKALEKKLRAVLEEEIVKQKKDTKDAGAKSASPKGQESAMPSLQGQLALLLSPWFRYFLSYDPRPTLQKVSCPVLAINGEKDTQVAAKENLEAIEKALRAGGNTGVTVRALPNLNHLFQTCKTGSVSEYGKIEETMSPTALELIAGWILEQAKPQRSQRTQRKETEK